MTEQHCGFTVRKPQKNSKSPGIYDFIPSLWCIVSKWKPTRVFCLQLTYVFFRVDRVRETRVKSIAMQKQKKINKKYFFTFFGRDSMIWICSTSIPSAIVCIFVYIPSFCLLYDFFSLTKQVSKQQVSKLRMWVEKSLFNSLNTYFFLLLFFFYVSFRLTIKPALFNERRDQTESKNNKKAKKNVMY